MASKKAGSSKDVNVRLDAIEARLDRIEGGYVSKVGEFVRVSPDFDGKNGAPTEYRGQGGIVKEDDGEAGSDARFKVLFADGLAWYFGSKHLLPVVE